MKKKIRIIIDISMTIMMPYCEPEKLSVPQVVCVMLIVIGIVGLKILGKE